MASRMDRGSHISLNEPPIPKHRKTRFQQSSLHKIKPSKGNADMLPPKKHSYDSLDGPPTSVSNPGSMKKARRSSFMPSKSLASATKLINQHLFGIQSANSKGKRQGNITLIITFHYFFITPAFFFIFNTKRIIFIFVQVNHQINPCHKTLRRVHRTPEHTAVPNPSSKISLNLR